MHLNPLDFNFLAILNLFVIVLWPAGSYTITTPPATPGPPRRNVFHIIMLILTVIAVVFDIIFIVLKLTGG